MIDINKVYTTVQALLNKEQRGYLAPTEFNRFAEQAQLEIFEGYFYDKSHFLTSRKGTDGMQVMNLDEKLNLFMVHEDASELMLTNNRFTLPGTVYRLCDVYINEADGTERIVAEIPHKGSRYIRNSSKLKPSPTFPKYKRYGNDLEVYPSMPSDIDYFPVTSTDAGLTYTLEYDDITSITRVSYSYVDTNGEYITVELTSNDYSIAGNIITITSAINPGDLRSEDEPPSLRVEYIFTSSITIEYYKRPDNPVWGYVGDSIYSSSRSTDFEIHPSDQYVLVIKILELAGAEIKDANVVQYAMQEQQVDNANKKS